MGCAQSDMQPANDSGHHNAKSKGKKGKQHSAASAPHGSGSNANGHKDGSGANNNSSPKDGGAKDGAGNPLTPQSARDDSVNFVGKQKYIVEVGAIAMEVTPRQVNGGGILLVYAPLETSGLVLSFRSKATNQIYARELTDAQLQKEKDSAGITHGWAPFFKSIASDITKSKANVSLQSGVIIVEVTVTSSKDPKVNQPFSFKLEAKSAQKPPKLLHRYFVEPMTRMIQKRRQNVADKDKELRFARAECALIVKEAAVKQHSASVTRLTPVITPLRESGANHSKASSALQTSVVALERKLRRLRQAKEGKHPLDVMYDDGGARYFSHLPNADEHVPRDLNPNPVLADLIKSKFPLKQGEELAVITRAPASPQLAKMLEQAPNRTCKTAMNVFTKLDAWDFNVFELEKATDGNALFFVTYALMYKLNLVSTFNIDDRILRNFLSAVQAGYHPNPYHNATHAADVAQINYFIMVKCGLLGICGLSQEDILASLLAGAIHDYDHPGFNNNFHTRTNAYLSTLYNDRSILENHHVACVYEIMRHPNFNIMAPLDDEKQRDVRETMIEMVLSTDMGNHAKIFSMFRRRLTESSDWRSRKEDVRLALSMSIKMADISNCSRPNHLYVEWAKNIANEFYNQGDHEAKQKLPISPFMDRRKDKTEFPKGQTSFMNYIVIPMLEAIAEFLPSLEFAIQHCTENKDYWSKQSS